MSAHATKANKALISYNKVRSYKYENTKQKKFYERLIRVAKGRGGGGVLSRIMLIC